MTLAEARAMVQASVPQHKILRQGGPSPAASPASVAAERAQLEIERRRENERRIQEYTAIMEIMKQHGVRGLGGTTAKQRASVKKRRAVRAAAKSAGQPLQIFAEGDSWFEYPVPFFGGAIIPRLQEKIGVPILNLAKAGDEVRYMLGVEERKILATQLRNGCPAGGPWDVLLFSGGGNDIVANPMALWVRDYQPAVPPNEFIYQPRFSAALALVRAGYEDLIALRDSLSPSTQLIFHDYDFAIPDGRGICTMGPWLKPTFDLRGFPNDLGLRTAVVKAMLLQFADLLLSLAGDGVTFINGQGTLAPVPQSWANELHPSKAGFDQFANLFRDKLKTLFPGRVL